ncbi:MAG: pyridoxal-phosphate dependent enzyme [Pseudomonadota bacterium]
MVADLETDELVPPSINEIISAHARIKRYIHRTPVLTSATFNQMLGAHLYFKCENFQKAGAFKARGAHNAVFALSDEEARNGVATHSSGNHGAALALAARSRDIPATVIMPRNAPTVKIDAVRNYGAEVVFCEPNNPAREAALDEVVAQTGAYFVHPYNNSQVIAGQGTCALEMVDEIRDLNVIITPVGGGGLLSGTAIAAKSFQPDIRVFAAEPEQADDAYRSMQSGKIEPMESPQTIADGLKTPLGTLTFPIIQREVDGIFLVSEDEIVESMKLIWERLKIVIEPSCATVLAALLKNKDAFFGQRIGLVLTGGNVDLGKLPW